MGSVAVQPGCLQLYMCVHSLFRRPADSQQHCFLQSPPATRTTMAAAGLMALTTTSATTSHAERSTGFSVVMLGNPSAVGPAPHPRSQNATHPRAARPSRVGYATATCSLIHAAQGAHKQSEGPQTLQGFRSKCAHSHDTSRNRAMTGWSPLAAVVHSCRSPTPPGYHLAAREEGQRPM